jgi:hypothetical protein
MHRWVWDIVALAVVLVCLAAAVLHFIPFGSW